MLILGLFIFRLLETSPRLINKINKNQLLIKFLFASKEKHFHKQVFYLKIFDRLMNKLF